MKYVKGRFKVRCAYCGRMIRPQEMESHLIFNHGVKKHPLNKKGE